VRKAAIVALAAAMLLVVSLASIAYADGPGGSTEHHCANSDGQPVPANADGSCPAGSTVVYDNDVTCGSNNDVGGFDVFVGASGLEICTDGGAAPVQGRVVASGDPAAQSGYAGADGDKDNSPEQAQGWLGVSSEAGTPLACGDTNGNRDLTHATGDDDVQDCLP